MRSSQVELRIVQQSGRRRSFASTPLPPSASSTAPAALAPLLTLLSAHCHHIISTGANCTSNFTNTSVSVKRKREMMRNDISVDGIIQSSSVSFGQHSVSRGFQNSVNNDKDNREDSQMEVEEKKTKQEEAVSVLRSNITRPLPVQLIRRPSEEGFHQVVKFTKRVAPSKAFAAVEFNEEIKTPEGNSPSSVEKKPKVQESDVVCMEGNFSANMLPECRSSTDESFKPLSCESVCYNSKRASETVHLIGISVLLQQQQKQQKYDETEAHLENCDREIDEVLEKLM
uniref:Calmodulin-binding domain-containing protein n=1 Tax=Setaria digitata TaxID=48799 RepID=A0A915PR65_9BILA